MTGWIAPLDDVFRELRLRGFPLGVQEYVLAAQVLAAGFGGDTRDGLRRVCQALWARTPEECDEIADLLRVMLPPRMEDDAAVDTSGATAGADASHENPAALGKSAGDPPDSDVAPRGVGSALPESRSALSPPTNRPWVLGTRFELIGSLPVSERQMLQAWRHLRRMSLRSRAEEFDAPATAGHLYRRGMLEPVLGRRRGGRARLLVLADSGGSMLPFSYVTAKLLGAAGRAGLARMDIRWFHDVIDDEVFKDEYMREPILLSEATRPFVDAGLLVYSDAGSARGRMDAARVERTVGMLAILRAVSPNIAWLNPVPAPRWPGTTAETIRLRSRVSMQPLDRDGLYATIDRLWGR